MNIIPETMPTSLPNTTKNQLWQLGQHRLLCGDATKSDDVARLMGVDQAALILTDPPYGVGYVEGKQAFLAKTDESRAPKFSVIAGDEIGGDYYGFSLGWLTAVRPHLAPKNAFYIFNGDTKLRELLNALHDASYTKSALLVWLKNHLVVGRKDFHPQHELIVYGWHGRHRFFGEKDKSALFYPRPNKSTLHPTMKPPALLRRLLYHSSQPGEIVLDPFGGSGSTLIACEHLGRRCFLIEQDEKYCQTIIQRWQKLTKQKAERID